MPMSSFGIYAAILILVVYAVIVLFFPPTLIFYERYIMNCCKNCCKKEEQQVDPNEVPKAKEKGRFQMFFGDTLNKFVAKFKWILLVVFGIWTIAAFFLAA